jgi:hypothetical protein
MYTSDAILSLLIRQAVAYGVKGIVRPRSLSPPGVPGGHPHHGVDFFGPHDDGMAMTKDRGYMEDAGLTRCIDSGVGKIQLEPLVRGTGVECEAVILDGDLLGIICTSEEPPAAAIYQLTD